MKGIYLASFKALHNNVNLVYQDINGQRDISGDMLDIDLSNYDFIIATPPCNYYSRANYRRDSSIYALNTKHLLPSILKKLISLNKPFLVENVRSFRLFNDLGLFDLPCFVYFIGRHTYWSNILFVSDIPQKFDFQYGDKLLKDFQFLGLNNRQGGSNVHNVVEMFLFTIGAKKNIDFLE